MKLFWQTMRRRKYLSLTVVMLVLCLSLITIPSLLAAGTPKKTKTYEELSYAKAQALYHVKINDLFNKKIKLMFDGKGSEKGNCKDENDVTTYCVAQQATEEYFLYRAALLKKQTQVTDQDLRTGEALFKRYIKGDVDAMLQRIDKPQTSNDNAQLGLIAAQRSSLINQELNTSQAALDKTLEAYNELKMAYPLHVEFEKTYKHLEKYRDQLKKVRTQLETYPGKFHDATTTQCQ